MNFRKSSSVQTRVDDDALDVAADVVERDEVRWIHHRQRDGVVDVGDRHDFVKLNDDCGTSPTTRGSNFPLRRLTYSMPTCLVASSSRSARIRARPSEISGCCVNRFRKSARVRVKTMVGWTVVTVADRGLPVSSDISPTAAPSRVARPEIDSVPDPSFEPRPVPT